MIKLKPFKSLLPALFISFSKNVKAQYKTEMFFTTYLRVFNLVSSFASTYKNSLALNSGIEYRLSKHYLVQFALDFNAVNYSPLVKDLRFVF